MSLEQDLIRHQHHLFAHALFRDAMLRGPSVVRAFMQTTSPDQQLLVLWKGAGKAAVVRSTEPEAPIPETTQPTVRVLEDGVLVRMPPPRAPEECAFIAALVRSLAVYYFTLERSAEGTAPWVLGEWNQVTHRAHGPSDLGSEPDEDAFLAAVRKMRDARWSG